MGRRIGVSLLELTVVIAILAILLGLLLSAIASIRNLASETDCLNRLRQITSACYQYASVNRGRFPQLINPVQDQYGRTVFSAILPFHEQHRSYLAHVLPSYRCPLDPTLAIPHWLQATSYAANSQLFVAPTRPSIDILDGASNTIAFAEHYGNGCSGTGFLWVEEFRTPSPSTASEFTHPATFAHDGPRLDKLKVNGQGAGDVYPITSDDPSISVGSISSLTFQVRPTSADCDPRIPQTGHVTGMPTSLADGSARILRQSISPTVFWGLVTPFGKEIVSHDW